MKFTRRDFLKCSSVPITLAIAGCSEEGEVNNPGNDDDSEPETDPIQTDSPTTETTTQRRTTTDQPQSVAQLGETLVYTEGQKRLAFTVKQALLRDAIVSSRSGRLYSTAPENSGFTYLTMQIEAENQGEERVSTPGNIVFTLNGTQYESTITSLQGDRYQPYNEIVPGSTSSGWLTFAVPPDESEGRFIVDFATFGEPVTGEWIVDIGEIQREAYDYTDQDLGDSITFGRNSVKYEFAAVEYEETRSYTYTSNGYQFNQEAGQGNKYVLLTVRGENTGDSVVYLPSTFDMSIITGSSQYDAEYYRGDQGYEGGEVSTGIERSGVVQFEVPQEASEYEFQVNLTQDISASWNF